MVCLSTRAQSAVGLTTQPPTTYVSVRIIDCRYTCTYVCMCVSVQHLYRFTSDSHDFDVGLMSL